MGDVYFAAIFSFSSLNYLKFYVADKQRERKKRRTGGEGERKKRKQGGTERRVQEEK